MADYFFKSALRHEVVSILKLRPRILAFDFDGTLVPFAPSPDDVKVPDGTINLLRKLSDDGSTTVSIVSGRKVEDLESLIGIPSVIYFGNHGMTSSADGFGAGKDELMKWSSEVSMIHERISFLESIFRGCRLENKGQLLSVHYRNVDEGRWRELTDTVERIASDFNYQIQRGKMVLELKPITDFTKGTALLEIAASGLSGWANGGPFLFAGDDSTDEDGFRAIKALGGRSFSFKVGEGETAADFRLHRGEVLKLIKIIMEE